MKRRALLITLACLLGFSLPAWAEVQQIRVLAVGIDRSSAAAEAKAIEFAKLRAMYLIARKLPVRDAGSKLSALTPAQMKQIIRGTTVHQTKRVGERTYAQVTVTIVDTALKQALGLDEKESDAVRGTEESLRGVLVLPVYVKDNRPYVWEEKNALRAPLREEVLRQAHGAILIPAGDLDDLRLVDYQNALTVTGQELGPMFTRYGADEIVVAIFNAEGDDKETPAILLRRLKPDATISEVMKVGGIADESQSIRQRVDAAARLIANAITQIASSRASYDQKRLDAATKIPVRFRYANTRELAQMQEILRSMPGVLLVEYPAISLMGISGTAYVEGDVEKLRESLRKKAIFVTQQGDTWQLSRR